MPSLDHVQDDVTSVLAEALPIAKPLVAVLCTALDNTLWLMDTTIGARMSRQFVEIVRLNNDGVLLIKASGS